MQPFWERKTLEQMSAAEWESLCDRCGRCCLKKLEDPTTGEVAYTDVACRLLDRSRCRCTRYATRLAEVADCIELTANRREDFRWLPSTCAYRRLAEGRSLEWWHPLVSGDPRTVHRAGISVRGRSTSEDHVAPEELEDRTVRWIKAPPLSLRAASRERSR